MSRPEEILRAVARDERKRVQRCELYDPNVCDFEFTDFRVHVDPSSKKYRVSAPLIRSGAPFTSKVGLLRSGHPVRIWANSETMLISVEGDLTLQTTFLVNSPKADHSKLTKLAVKGLHFPVFIRSAVTPTKDLLDFLSRSDVQLSIHSLLRGDTDSLHFRVGEVALYVRPQSVEQARNAIDILLSFVGPFRPQPEQWDLAELPAEFRPLVPLIKKWAEPDDSVRSDLITEAREPSLRELINKVAPLFDAINKYLDTFDNSLPEGAMALQALAEAAAEAQVAIKDRGGRN